MSLMQLIFFTMINSDLLQEKKHGLILMASTYIIQNHEKVSSCECKELGSHHSVLKQQQNKRKNNTSSRIPRRGEDTGQTIIPKIGEKDRQIQRARAYWSSDPQGVTSEGTST